MGGLETGLAMGFVFAVTALVLGLYAISKNGK